MKPVCKVTPVMRKAIQLEIENPTWTGKQIAAALGKNQNTIYCWWDSPCYIQERDRVLKEAVSASAKKFIASMIKASDNGNIQATKYLLDFCGYGSEQKFSLNTDKTFEIKIIED